MRNHHAIRLVSPLALASLSLLAACAPVPPAELLPEPDLSPPALLSASPRDSRGFVLAFDEEVSPVASSFGLEPSKAGKPLPGAAGRELELTFPEEQVPGLDYELAGEVKDSHGNRTRFVLSFVGFNARPPSLRLSEIQTGKNSSSRNPHRDFVELHALSAGNLGGVELAWTSTAKAFTYRFPPAEVQEGDFVVLHLAPEGLPNELDETGNDAAASGGIDSSPTGRDFWSKAGGLPDATGIVCLRSRPGGSMLDALLYAEEGKTGAIPEGKLAAAAAEAVKSEAWAQSGESLCYEDSFAWKPSSSRSICRSAAVGDPGKGEWYVSGSGMQSPGARNPGPDAVAPKAGKESAKPAGKGR
jgi:hypothetical protein